MVFPYKKTPSSYGKYPHLWYLWKPPNDKWLKGKWKSLLIDVLNSTLGAIKRAKGAVLVRKMTDPQGIHRMPAKHRDCTGGEKKHIYSDLTRKNSDLRESTSIHKWMCIYIYTCIWKNMKEHERTSYSMKEHTHYIEITR